MSGPEGSQTISKDSGREGWIFLSCCGHFFSWQQRFLRGGKSSPYFSSGGRHHAADTAFCPDRRAPFDGHAAVQLASAVGNLSQEAPGSLCAACAHRRFFFPFCDCALTPLFRASAKGVPVAITMIFLMAGPLTNPVVLVSTWYAFGGDLSMVGGRLLLGWLNAVLVGATFAFYKKNPLKAFSGPQGTEELIPSEKIRRPRSFFSTADMNSGTPSAMSSWAPGSPPYSRYPYDRFSKAQALRPVFHPSSA